MKRVLSLICVAMLCAGSVRAGEATTAESPSTVAKPWPHERSDLRADARVTWGKLDNGLRYAILPTKSAPAQGSLRMLVEVGSGMEDDDQQGMAHFLEHMAFNGTKHFAAGETYEYFQRLGMSFGAHTNAITQIDHTCYQLELPRANEALVGDGLRLFRDFLDGMLLDPREIEKERGVVLSEQVARNTAGYRAATGVIRAALAGTKLAERLPLGKTETVRKMTRERFVEFYETWYTPGRTVIVAVGDFDKDLVERLIRKHFADARARRGEAAEPNFGKLAAGAGLAARYDHVPDAASTTVSISCLTPLSGAVEDSARQRSDVLNLLVQQMVARRLERLAAAPAAPFQAAVLADESFCNMVRRNFIAARCAPQQWTAALAAVEQELRRARRHGFTEAELTAAQAELQSLFELVVAREETRRPEAAADDLVESLTERSVFMSARDRIAIVERFLPGITTADCARHLNARWDTNNLEASVSGNLERTDDAPRQILAAYQVSGWRNVAPPVDAAATKFAFTDFGPAGEIVSRREHADLGLVQAEFANHVRVNIKSTPFEKNKIRTLVRFGGGLLELPADKPGLQLFAADAFIAGGLRGLSLTELNRQIADKNVGVVFNVGDDAFQLVGNCVTSGLELQLQLCTAYLTAPGYGPETERRFFETMQGVYAQHARTPEGVIRYDGNAFLRSDDHRYVLPSPDRLGRLTLADVRDWLARPLAAGYLEVTIVGDVDPEQALNALTKTLGALPERAPAKPDYAAARAVKFPTSIKAKQFTYESDTERAVSAVCWPMPGVDDVALNRRLYVLRLVLADRVRQKVREELGAAYTPEVAYFSSAAFPRFGYLVTQLMVEPARLPQMAELSKAIAAELASGPIGDDEFQRAVRPLLASIEPRRRDNGYWLGALADAHERPAALDVVRSDPTDYAAITKAEIEALARRYLTTEAALVLSIAPTPTKAMAAK